MTHKPTLLLIALTVAASCLAGVTLDLDDWGAVNQLARGTQVDVVRSNLKRESGRFASSNESEMTVETGRGPLIIPREEVVRVGAKKGSRSKRMLLGALIGAGAGAAVGLVGANAGDVDVRRDLVAGVTALGGAGIGAGAGAAMPSYRTVYRRPTPELSAGAR